MLVSGTVAYRFMSLSRKKAILAHTNKLKIWHAKYELTLTILCRPFLIFYISPSSCHSIFPPQFSQRVNCCYQQKLSFKRMFHCRLVSWKIHMSHAPIS